MSYKPDNVQIGDIIDLTTTSVYAHKAGVVVAKFLVLAKEPSEANNNKSVYNDSNNESVTALSTLSTEGDALAVALLQSLAPVLQEV